MGRVVIGVAVLAAAALIVQGFLPRAAEVDAAPVLRGDLTVTVDEEGRTRVRERYTVAAPIAGRLRRIPLKAGAKVEAGRTVLAVLEPMEAPLLDERARAEAQARVKAAEAAARNAEARREEAKIAAAFAESEAARIRTVGPGAMSKQEMDETLMLERLRAQELRSAEFAMDVAKYEVELAHSALLRAQGQTPGDWLMEVRSPVSGSVLRVFEESERALTVGTHLLEVGDAADIEVLIEVLSQDAVRIGVGAPVAIEHWGGERALSAVVRVVEPSAFTKISALGVEEQRVNVIADLTEPREERESLGDQYRVEAKIEIERRNGVLKAPTSALFRRGGRWAAYVVEAGRAAEREIEVGQRNGLEAEILDGLREGERVIVHPSDQVRDGRSVKVRE